MVIKMWITLEKGYFKIILWPTNDWRLFELILSLKVGVLLPLISPSAVVKLIQGCIVIKMWITVEKRKKGYFKIILWPTNDWRLFELILSLKVGVLLPLISPSAVVKLIQGCIVIKMWITVEKRKKGYFKIILWPTNYWRLFELIRLVPSYHW